MVGISSPSLYMNNAQQHPANQLVGLIVLIALGVGGAWMYGNFIKATNEASQAPVAEQGYVPTPRNPSQAVDISAAALYAAYDDNEVRFKQQYEGKTVNVTGTIYRIFDDSIMFDSSTNCYLSPDQVGKLAQFSKGQTIKVQGVVEDAFAGFRIADCVVL